MTTAPVGDLERLAPDILLRYLARSASRNVPTPTRVLGSSLFIDIVGSTALTSYFATRGPDGVEMLANILNKFFALLTDTVYQYGGDVIAFAGDAIIALWPAFADKLHEASLRAAACALSVRQSLDWLQTPEIKSAGGIRVSMYIATGDFDLTVLRGAHRQHHFLVTGTALAHIQSKSGTARPNEIMVSPGAHEAMQGLCYTTPLNDGWQSLARLALSVEVLPVERTAVPRLRLPILRSFLSSTTNRLLDLGNKEWASEFRKVTVVLIRLDNALPVEGGVMTTVQQAFSSIASTVDIYGGFIQSVQVDDKGFVIMTGFGLPFAAYEDDARRGVALARAIVPRFAEIAPDGHGARVSCSIGVATGQVFCGFLGGLYRTQYTLVGDPANLAARLMVEAQGGILCDEATCRAGLVEVSFARRGSLSLKGFTEPVEIFAPIAGSDRSAHQSRAAAPLFGRGDERRRLKLVLEAVRDAESSQVIWIEGDPGIGKSRLLKYLAELAADLDIALAQGAGDRIGRRDSYKPWKSMLTKLLAGQGHAEATDLTGHVLGLLQSDPLFVSWAPILSSLLPLGLEESEVTLQMTAQARADATAELVVHLLLRSFTDKPLLLALDDGQWVDSASWALLLAICRRIPKVVVAIATRPIDSPSSIYDELLQRQKILRIPLGPLDPPDLLALAQATLGVQELPMELEGLMLSKCAGSPFFCEEMVFALRDSGAIQIEAERCSLAENIADGWIGNIPATVQGIIVSRLDVLNANEQLLLKVASAIGSSFDLNLLSDVFPVEMSDTQLRHRLDRLHHHGLVLKAQDGIYAFRHVITQDIVYTLLTQEQRKHLHQNIAEWFEFHYADKLDLVLSTLAHHWGRCGSFVKASEYLVLAGQNALAQYANEEAVRLLSEALELESRFGYAEKKTRARWEAHLAEAYLKLSDFGSSRRHLGESLRLLGQPVPRSGSLLIASLPFELLRHGLRRLRGPLEAPDTSAVASERALRAHLHQLRAEVAFFDHDLPSLFHATVVCQAEAQEVGPSPVLARSYGTTGIVASIAGLSRIAERHCKRGLDIARGAGDLPTLAYINQLASVYYNGLGEWALADETICEATELNRQLGDRYRWQSCLMMRAYLRMYRGDFLGVTELVDAVRPVAFPDGIAQVRAWCVAVELLSDLARGSLRQQLIVDGNDVLGDSIDTSEEILVRGSLALAHVRACNFVEARRHAEIAANLIARFPPPTYYTMGGMAAVAEALLSLSSRTTTVATSQSRGTSRRARMVNAELRKFARKFPFAQPRYLLLSGQLAALRGRRHQANRFWNRCIEEATARSMPYEEGLAHLMLSGQTNADAENREWHEHEGHRILEELGISNPSPASG